MRPLLITSGLIGAAVVFGACASARSVTMPLTLCSSISLSGSSFVCNVASSPTAAPVEPTAKPAQPTVKPTMAPTSSPTSKPVVAPTLVPVSPTLEPTDEPTTQPTSTPTDEPLPVVTLAPTNQPTVEPTDSPTMEPTAQPTVAPTPSPSPTASPEPTPAPVSVNPIPKSFTVGKPQTFTISQDGFVGGFAASSSNENVAEVSVNGTTLTVLPIAAGTATITVYGNGESDSMSVTSGT